MSKKINLLLILSTLAVGILLISNIAAVKLWSFFGVAVDGGLIIFPLSYIVGDLITEFFGRKIAAKITLLGFLVSLLAVAVFFLNGLLPAHPDWQGQSAYESILGFTPRIVAGSLAAYLFSQLLDQYIFDNIKKATKGKKFWLRALGSSIVARLVDTIVFETIAFFGVLPLGEFFKQALFAWGAGTLLELLFIPFSALIVRLVHRSLKVANLP